MTNQEEQKEIEEVKKILNSFDIEERILIMKMKMKIGKRMVEDEDTNSTLWNK